MVELEYTVSQYGDIAAKHGGSTPSGGASCF